MSPAACPTVVINGTDVPVEITDTDLEAARASLLRFGQPGDEFFTIAAGSYVRAAEDRLAYPPATGTRPDQAYASARRAHAVIAAYVQLTAGSSR